MKKLLSILLVLGLAGCSFELNILSSSSRLDSSTKVSTTSESTKVENSSTTTSSNDNSNISSSSSSSNNNNTTDLSSTSAEITRLYEVCGKVVDTDNNPIQGVEVSLKGEYTYSKTSSSTGEFSFLSVEKGTYTISLALPDGYQVNSFNNQLTVDGDDYEITISTIVLKKENVSWGELQ